MIGSITVSAGYVLWDICLHYLLATFLLGKPLWRNFDYLGLLDAWYNRPEERQHSGRLGR